MTYLFYFGIVFLSFWLMEFVAWASHRYIMHGPLWYLHEDHHRKSPGFFERNDLFFLLFATPSFLSILFGALYKQYWLVCIGVGILLYGAAYFIVHDVIIHQRFKWFRNSDNKYIRDIRWAHKMHHKHLDKHDGESFGMLIIARKYRRRNLS